MPSKYRCPAKCKERIKINSKIAREIMSGLNGGLCKIENCLPVKPKAVKR